MHKVFYFIFFCNVPDIGLLPNERLAVIVPPHGENLAAHGGHYLVIVLGPGRVRDRSIVRLLYPQPSRRFAIYAYVGGEFVALPRYATEITCCRRLRFNPLYRR